MFSLPICVIMGLRNASPVGRGGGEADGEGSTVRKEPSHPLLRELSQRESLWTRSSIFRGMGFARCGAVSLFALSFGFAQTNALSQTSVGRGLAPAARLFALYIRLQPMFALNQRLPCVRGAGAERLRGWRDAFKVVRCSALRTANPSVIFLRKCHLPLHKGGLK